jgi:type I restriction-modification system DNA methylase subunit
MQKKQQQDQSQIKWISDFIWNIADDRLRDVYVRGKYRDVILPFTVLRRLDAVLEATKDAVLERKKFLDTHKVAEQDGALRMAAGQAFYNVSEFTLAKLKASAAGQRLRDDFIAYLDGFSPNVQEILTKFNFRNQIQKLVDSCSFDGDNTCEFSKTMRPRCKPMARRLPYALRTTSSCKAASASCNSPPQRTKTSTERNAGRIFCSCSNCSSSSNKRACFASATTGR